LVEDAIDAGVPLDDPGGEGTTRTHDQLFSPRS
jgi:hypothetical protein